LWTSSTWPCFIAHCTSGLHSIRPSGILDMCWKVPFIAKAACDCRHMLNLKLN
jgi:hypothetical protein